MSAAADVAVPPPTPIAGAPWAQTPTGLWAPETQQLDDDELQVLTEWHIGKSGSDDGRMWWPAAIRRMPLHERLRLASDPYLDAAWERQEQEQVKDSPVYLLLSYGSMQDEEGSPPTPFEAWPEQIDVMRAFRDHKRIIVLKARQLGLTWIALHYALWLMAFCRETPRARILCMSKQGDDAAKLLKRARKMNSLLPRFMRLDEDKETYRSNSQFKLQGRGAMESLPGTPDAARSETAGLILMDEGAFYRNGGFGATWTAAQPTLGRHGTAIVISTGNGPAEAPGDGRGYAQLWNRGRSSPDSEFHTIFLPSKTDPRRTEEWRKKTAETYLDPIDFEAEYPETEEQALAGVSGTKVYLPSGINAAESIGGELDGLLMQGKLEPYGGLIEVAIDWGESTHMLGMWPLEQGGFYVFTEYAPEQGPNVEPGDSARRMLGKVRQAQRSREQMGRNEPWPLIAVNSFDGAGVQSQKTMKVTVEEDPRLLMQYQHVRASRGRRAIRHRAIPFNECKDEGKDYLRYLFRRTAIGKETGIIAISPTCRELLRQLRGLELEEDGSGRIKKGDDHGPDALIAGVAATAARYRGREAPTESAESVK